MPTDTAPARNILDKFDDLKRSLQPNCDAYTLTLNQRLTVRGYTTAPGPGYSKRILRDGVEVACLNAHEGSAWVSTGCPVPSDAWRESYYGAEQAEDVAARKRQQQLVVGVL